MFAALMLIAVAPVAWPAWRASGAAPGARALLAASLALFVIGVAGGAYLFLGKPELARRALAGPATAGVPGLVAELSRRMRDRPNDPRGWTLLGRGYLSLADPGQAAIAFHRASELVSPREKPELLSSYGEALTLAAGTVTPEAEAAFRATLAARPADFAARFYLGQAYVERHDPARALVLWRSLLADAPSDAPWRGSLIDRMAALEGKTGSSPDVRAMVAGLAARLAARPDDVAGWQRLLRAYSVLGEDGEARSALLRARAAMRGRPEDLAALDAEARSLKLEK